MAVEPGLASTLACGLTRKLGGVRGPSSIINWYFCGITMVVPVMELTAEHQYVPTSDLDIDCRTNVPAIICGVLDVIRLPSLDNKEIKIFF